MCTKRKLDILLNRIVVMSQEQFGTALDKVILYGSYARGDYREDSDIDIMLLLNCEDAGAYRYREIAANISSEIGLDMDEVVAFAVRSSDDFKSKKSWYPFYKNINTEGKLIYG